MSSRKLKTKRMLENRAALRYLKSLYGFDVLEFEVWHLRLVGCNTVDYWPSTGRGWLVGSRDAASEMTVQEVVILCIGKLPVPSEIQSVYL